MPRKSRSLLIGAAIASLLFFGVGLSTAEAGHFGRGGRFGGRFAGPRGSFHSRFVGPRARFVVHARPFAARPFFHSFQAPFPHVVRRHRVVRVFVRFPFPHFVYRRVFFAGFGPDCW